MSRPTRESLHMLTALMWSQRSLCKRLHVGSVITSADMRQVLAIGYNGPGKGLPHDRCRGEQPGACGCVHSEANAIAAVDSTIPNKLLFVSHQPCETCAQLVMNAGIRAVYYWTTYRDDTGANLLRSADIPCQPMALEPWAVGLVRVAARTPVAR